MSQLQAYRPSYSKWESHFKAMSNGTLKRKKGKIVTLSSGNQTGAGVEMISPVEQVVHMAEAKKKPVKTKGKKGRSHSTTRPRKVKKSKKPKRLKKNKGKQSNKRRRR